MQHVLIVEDDIQQNNLIRKTIQKQYKDWIIDSATSYDAALTLLQTSKSPYTIFLLDIQLSLSKGDHGGFFLAKEIRKQSIYYTTPILFLTAISDEGYYALSEFHCYNYICKPYTPLDLLYQLEQMLITGYLQNLIRIKDTQQIHHKISVQDIAVIEAKSRSVVFYVNDAKIHSRDFTLATVTTILTENFVQAHRKYLINTNLIHNYDHRTRYARIGNYTIPVSRSFYPAIKEYL